MSDSDYNNYKTIRRCGVCNRHLTSPGEVCLCANEDTLTLHISQARGTMDIVDIVIPYVGELRSRVTELQDIDLKRRQDYDAVKAQNSVLASQVSDLLSSCKLHEKRLEEAFYSIQKERKFRVRLKQLSGTLLGFGLGLVGCQEAGPWLATHWPGWLPGDASTWEWGSLVVGGALLALMIGRRWERWERWRVHKGYSSPPKEQPMIPPKANIRPGMGTPLPGYSPLPDGILSFKHELTDEQYKRLCEILKSQPISLNQEWVGPDGKLVKPAAPLGMSFRLPGSPRPLPLSGMMSPARQAELDAAEEPYKDGNLRLRSLEEGQ